MTQEEKQAAFIAERKLVEDARKARAAENLADHVYTRLFTGPGVEAWRCAEPRSSFYAFDILITRFGIAVVGDIENMTFVVGAQYGMEFLAKNDVTYYIHSKLDPKCKEVEFDQDAWRDMVVRGACSRIRDISTDEDVEQWPAWVDNRDLQTREIYTDVMNYADSKREHEQDLSWTNLYDLMSEAEDIDYTDAAMVFLRDNDEGLCLCDTEQSEVEKVCESVYANLYMINHAAKAIMAIKALATEVGGKVDE